MKIALIGYGKMGKTIEQIAIARGHEIVARIDIDNQDDFTSPEFKSADVAIEFSQPQSAMDNYRRAFAAGVKVVSGTTGWLESMPEVKEACENGNTFFYSSNYSLGVNIFFALNKYLAKIMNGFANYEVSMEETHHIHKLDAPSGTAITLAEGIIENVSRIDCWTEEKSADNELQINHEREGEVPGTHIISWDSEVDTITIEHKAKSREGFALGAVVAAEWVASRNGFLTMKEMMKELIQD